MNRIAGLVSAAAIACAAASSSAPLIAQVPRDQAASASENATPDLKLADVEAALAAIEADAGIEDAVKELLRPKYKQAIDALKEAADFAGKAAECREAMKTGSQRAAQLRDELKALPSAESAADITATGTTEDLQKDVEARRATLDGLGDDLSRIRSELTRVKGLPVEIGARLPEAQRELSEVRKQLESLQRVQDATSPGRVADRILLQALQAKLLSELEMLQREQASQLVREALLQAQHELLTRQVENAMVALKALEESLHERLANEVTRVRSLVDKLIQDLPEGDQAVQALAAEVQALAKEFEGAVEDLKEVKAAQDDVAGRLKELTEEYESIREQLKLGGGGRAMAQALYDMQSRAFEARAELRAAELPSLSETRQASFEVRTKFRRHSDVEGQFADPSSDAVVRLVAARREVLEKLQAHYEDLIRALAVLEGDKKQYLDKAEEVGDYVSQQFIGFGIRSCPPLGVKTVTGIPGGLRWVFGGDHWRELGLAVQWTAASMPVRTVGMILLVAVLLLMRPRIGAALEATGGRTRRISEDRYAYTCEALVWTSLLAIPIPLLFGFAGWAVGQTPEPSDWLRGVAYGLRLAASVTLTTEFMAAVCRPGGLGVAHFRWRKETLARLRSAIHRFTVVYIPAMLLVSSCTFGLASQHYDSVGRVSFILAHVWTAIVLWRFFGGTDGILARLASERPTSLLTRWRYVWFPLLLACPLALVVIAGLGYLFTAVEYSVGLIATAAQIAVGTILYALAMRWLVMRQRKLALAHALERRRARQEAADSPEQQEQPAEVVSVDAEVEEEPDLEKTRVLLRLLFGLGVAVAIVVFWSETLPLIAVLESTTIPMTGGLSLLGLSQAVLVLVVTYIVTRSLPGLLELGVLRAATTDAGTRHAIATLCQYAVVAIGLFAFFNVLQVDWAKFGWIAAGLSVGLGFGLQEVVANFVCGLILMFERPIRLGDIVTVEGTTGTVTKMHIRATTITNWDRQEFVVPNKTLITNTLLNWTLSAPLNRIVIPVGVAYGSNTQKARQIMLDAAADHPLILDDPAPMASFEQFADSSLTLILRAFLPNLDNRIKTITELHTEIDQRFAAAGIEIAYPQQDVHLRSGWNDRRNASSDDTETG